MKRGCRGIAGLLCAIAVARAQTPTQLEQQLQELKQQYAETARAMEQRIAVLADRFGLHHAFILAVICYLYILFYALSGSRPNSERYARG
jgi:hypothetical protein